MTRKKTQKTELSNPFSTGGGGPRFENQVQTLFVVLMLTESFVPCLTRPLPIKKIKLQGRYDGYHTDDFIAFVEDATGEQKAKLLAQIKHSIKITQNDPVFADVIQAAWSDFNDEDLFDKETDAFALITGPLSARDNEAITILDWARKHETAEDFLRTVSLTKFSSGVKRQKLAAFRVQLEKANQGEEVGDEKLWRFLKRFHLLPCDLDASSGLILSLIRSSIAQYTNTDPSGIFDIVTTEVGSFNQSAGTLTRETVSVEIKRIFSRRVTQIPPDYVPAQEIQSHLPPSDYAKSPQADALTFASLLGGWNEKVEGDREVVRKLVEGND